MPIIVGNTTTNSAITSTTLTEMSPQSYQVTNALRNSVRPALLLPFAQSGVVDPRITFTRASSATYFNSQGVLSTAANNTPRIDFDPATGACNGLLIEQASTNLITYSGNVATWSTQFSTLTANATKSPDGTTTAALMIPSVDLNNNHYINYVWNGSVGNSITFTVSVFAKSAGYQWIRMNPGNAMGGGYLFFDIINGVIGTYGGVSNPAIQPCGNGWFRCSYQYTTPASGTGDIGHQIYAANSNNGFSNWSGNGTSGYYFWGAQVEQLAFPTSYIATAGATVTRAQEQAKLPLGSWYNAPAFSLLIEGQKNTSADSGSYGCIVELNDGTASHRSLFFVGLSTTNLHFSAATSSADIIVGAYAVSTPYKAAGAITGTSTTTGTIAASLNGATAVTGTTTNLDSALYTNMNIAFIGGGGNVMNGWIQRIAYYPVAFSNTQLQAMSS